MISSLNNKFPWLNELGHTLRKYLWDSITFPVRIPTLERIITWIVAPHCYVRLFNIIVLGLNHTPLNLIFKIFRLDIFGSPTFVARLASAGLAMDPLPWFITLVSLFLAMYFSARYQRKANGRIDPNWGPLAYLTRGAFVFFALFVAPF